MSERVDDLTCGCIQDLMVNWEKQIDALAAAVKKQNRDSSALAIALRDLHKEVCKVHRYAGLEMER